MSDNFINEEAKRILDRFVTLPFEQAYPLSRTFSLVPIRTGVYGFRHAALGLLYIGKAANIQQRIRNGHKALAWAFIDRLNPDEVRVVAEVLRGEDARKALLDIEATMIQIARPSYNIVVRQRR
ncbi:MAG: GIY-YIG nuclease family protein [Alkalinema sp. RU_4_3]|nr:GIY-YIG nuclease family protein [Alkalinema sp. RU_4_3]